MPGDESRSSATCAAAPVGVQRLAQRRCRRRSRRRRLEVGGRPRPSPRRGRAGPRTSRCRLASRRSVSPGDALGELDRGVRKLLAEGVGAALDLLDALQCGGELGAGGLALALAVALQALDRRASSARARARPPRARRGPARAGRRLGAVERARGGAGGVGAAGGLGDRLGGARLGGGDRLGQPGVGQRRGLNAVALELVEPGGPVLGGGLGLSSAAPAARGGRARSGRPDSARCRSALARRLAVGPGR